MAWKFEKDTNDMCLLVLDNMQRKSIVSIKGSGTLGFITVSSIFFINFSYNSPTLIYKGVCKCKK